MPADSDRFLDAIGTAATLLRMTADALRWQSAAAWDRLPDFASVAPYAPEVRLADHLFGLCRACEQHGAGALPAWDVLTDTLSVLVEVTRRPLPEHSRALSDARELILTARELAHA